MQPRHAIRPSKRHPRAGMTLLELVLACAILLVLSSAAMPIVRTTVVRQRENELRRDLREMRTAIDRYKDAADQAGSDVGKVRFLRKVPVDPMTGRAEWGLRSVQDDPDSRSWGGHNVFDVYSQSEGTALDGTKYADW